MRLAPSTATSPLRGGASSREAARRTPQSWNAWFRRSQVGQITFVTRPAGQCRGNWSFTTVFERKKPSAGGPPFLPRLFLSRSETLGAPSLRFLQGRVRCCRYHVVCHAQRIASHLWRASPALYHLLVLPAIAFSQYRSRARLFPYDSGADTAAIPLRGRRVCCDAGAHSSAVDGARGRNSLDRDAGGGWPRLLISLTQTKLRVPRPLRSLQRAGTTNTCATGFVQRDKGRAGSITTRPCKKRKDGAPPA
jgi:hypothetical protein